MHPKHPKTIQIFLPTGEPQGIRIAEESTSIMRVIEVPRRDLATFFAMEEASQVGVYFLIGGMDNDEVYIGQSGEVGKRLKQHHDKNEIDFTRALVLVSLTQNLTQTHALYLEWLAIEKATQSGRFSLSNGNKGQKTHTPLPLKAACEAMFEIGELLLSTLGYPIFEPLRKPTQPNSQPEQIFHCPRGGVQAQAIYTQDGMIVLKGSHFAYQHKDDKTPLYRQKFITQCDELIEKGVLHKEKERCFFTKDFRFNSPSGAACLLTLSSVNGWIEFKTAQGKTLKEIYANPQGKNDD
ncbi:GIY-YIG nuclease family protein [Avibacterium sp. 20-15]|uniref:GIY-YIG nuclease family protein n=1 Tax=unclassified Avibacterium TaxID=2685287 RepID=UPI0020268304|nr:MULTISPECIES: GIY-YIG nuclease family protein [unclassified Avibacterium]MCW9732770.1 GIY-YIG nuclease family protein [Avibacterium sp. 20-15]URL04912.1 GIY-YIG nuclease family protein [Avibacterium sp. 20-132]